VSSARRRKKLAKEHLTWRSPPAHAGATEEDRWESGKGAATSARYDKKWYRHEGAGQLFAYPQAPVKYSICKHSGGGHHCPPDLFEMRQRLAAERKARESEPKSLE